MFEKQGNRPARDEAIGILIGAVRRRIKQTTGRQLRGTGLSPQQFWTLMAIHDEAGCSLRSLCERRWIDAPTASRVVATLAAKRLVRVGGDSADRRRCRLELTSSGHALAERLLPLLDAQRATLVRGLSASEHQSLRALLHRLIDNLAPRRARRQRPRLVAAP